MLRPSRRLPRAFSRPSSPFSRALAQALYQRTGVRRAPTHFARLQRRGRRFLYTLRDALRHLKLWSIVFIAALAVAALLLFFFSPLFRISSVRVSRQDARLDIGDIQQLLLPFFGKHFFFLSPNLIEHTILTAYPDVVAVKVVKRFPSELRLMLHTDPIVASVQLGSPDDTERSFTPLAGSGTYRYLTARGVYLEYPMPVGERKSDEEPLRIRLVDWAVKPVHRQRLLGEIVLRDMLHVRRLLLQSFGHTVHSITSYVRAREFHVETEHLTLWFGQGTPMVQQIDRYREFLRAVPPESAAEYVDLRLHDRVVYR